MPHGTVIPHHRVTDIGIENPVVVATVIFAGWDSRRSYKGSNNSRWEFIVSILFVMGIKVNRKCRRCHHHCRSF